MIPCDHPPFLGHSSADRIRAELGYAPLRTYEDGMAEATAWGREHEPLPETPAGRA